MMRNAILFLAATALFAAEPGVKWETSLEAAQARARAEHKLILMDVWTEWCGWCIKLQKDTFPTPEAQAALAKVVPLSLKTQLAHGEPTPQNYIEKKYNVQGFPALIMLDADGKEVTRQPGYLPAKPFADWVNKLAASRK
jgi:thiol:disulfide interchange protein